MSTNGHHDAAVSPLKAKVKKMNGNAAPQDLFSNGHANGVSNGHANGVSNGRDNGTPEAEAGKLLQRVLALVLEARLVTGMDASEKVVHFKHPHELKKELDLTVAAAGCSLEEAEKALQTVVHYSVKTQHPHFYNQLYGGIDEVALTGAWLTEALNTNQYTFEVAPVFMIVEHRVIELLLGLYGWAEGDGIFAPGGSVSNMYGMILARYRRHPEVKRTGVFGQKPLVVFTSDQGHYSISKSASWLGLGMDNAVAVATDAQGRMLPAALQEAVAKARQEGKEPFMVNATAGTTVLGAFDPLEALADVCEKEGLWLHVDACWGGAVVLSRRHKHLMKGVERVDSLSWNPHKMLGTSLQTSVFLTKHKNLLQQSNSARATYLFQQDKFYDVSFDTGDKSVQCGRKVDAFKLWLSLKVHGLEALEAMVNAAFHAARHLCTEIRRREDKFRLVQEPECTNVCFWFIPKSMRGEEETPEWWVRLSKVAPAIKERMVKAGTLMVGYSPIACKSLVNFFRMVTTCTPTPTPAHMDFVLEEIERLGEDL